MKECELSLKSLYICGLVIYRVDSVVPNVYSLKNKMHFLFWNYALLSAFWQKYRLSAKWNTKENNVAHFDDNTESLTGVWNSV